jgi:regulator of telomere elongation helicase 1
VSEGLDFADRAGRAVVVTGIPFAMKMDPKVRLKREYLDEQMRQSTTKSKTLSGEEWYVQQASRAVNQAVGRVIRHRHDYGAIILCDERFAQAGPQSQMSLWLRPHIKCYSKFGDSAFTLTRFFRDKVGAAGPVKPLNSIPATSGYSPDPSHNQSQIW